jgi:protein transport protein SEC61 subunit gamma-like protein
MSDQVQEILEVPSEFVRDGVQFVRRCTKRTSNIAHLILFLLLTHYSAADQKEFLRLCQAVGVGFLIMGAVGYVVKLGTTSNYLPHTLQPLTELQCTFPSTTLLWVAHKRSHDQPMKRIWMVATWLSKNPHGGNEGDHTTFLLRVRSMGRS